MPPEDVIESYVHALAHGKCSKAYDYISIYEKKTNPLYSTKSAFANNICKPVTSKYTMLRIYSIDSIVGEGANRSMYFRISYKARLLPGIKTRDMFFTMRKIAGRWYIDGPDIQI